MTKYFLINNDSRAAVYGIGTYIRQISNCIQNSMPQYELNFIDVYSDVKEFTVDRDESGILHYRIPSLQSRNKEFSYYRCALFLLNPYMPEEESMIFHFNYGQHYDLMRLVKAKYKFSHIIYTIHYQNWCFTLNGNLTRFRRLINGNAEESAKESVQKDYQNDKRLFSLCDGIIVLSKFTYNLLQIDYKVDASKLHLIYNGMKEESCTSHYSNKEDTKEEILFVGRLDEIKGVEYIIRAFKKVVAHRKSVHLTFIGDGNFSRYLSLCDGIWRNVTFTGKLAKEKLKQFFCMAKIGIQPSFHEQCSYSAIEMMAYGIPFIATDSTGLGEMMDYTPECLIHIDEENFQPDDFENQLAEKMESLLSNQQLRNQVSKNLRRLFQERYSLTRMGTALDNLLSGHKAKEPNISKDFLYYLDNEMIRLINKRPILDMDYVGLTGIGCYLWRRVKSLNIRKDDNSILNSTRIQEYLIYFIDWMDDVLEKDGRDAFSPLFQPIPLHWLLNNLLDTGFYKTKVSKILHQILSLGIDLKGENTAEFDDTEIARTALKIYNLNL